MIAGAILLAILTFIVVRRYRMRPVPVASPTQPHDEAIGKLQTQRISVVRHVYHPAPYDEAIESLETLLRENLPAQGQLKEHCDRLSNLVRRYLTRLDQASMGLTTQELLDGLDRTSMALGAADQLEKILTSCDQAKFAGTSYGGRFLDELTSLTRSFLALTRNRPGAPASPPADPPTAGTPSEVTPGAQDPLTEQARNLVTFANINAITMFTPLLSRFPCLGDVESEQWDFILTVAGVFVAATRLSNLRLGDSREEALMEIIANRLVQWNLDGIRGFEDCKGVFERTFDGLTASGHEPQFVPSDAVGLWITWNLLGRSSLDTDEERHLVRATGGIVTHAFFDWWTAP